MSVGVVMLNFGEPEDPTLENVTPFLERIFQMNAPLEGSTIEPSQRARSRELAAAPRTRAGPDLSRDWRLAAQPPGPRASGRTREGAPTARS